LQSPTLKTIQECESQKKNHKRKRREEEVERGPSIERKKNLFPNHILFLVEISCIDSCLF